MLQLKKILTMNEKQLDKMQDNKKWVESIQMNIKGISPLYIIVPVRML